MQYQRWEVPTDLDLQDPTDLIVPDSPGMYTIKKGKTSEERLHVRAMQVAGSMRQELLRVTLFFLEKGERCSMLESWFQMKMGTSGWSMPAVAVE